MSSSDTDDWAGSDCTFFTDNSESSIDTNSTFSTDNSESPIDYILECVECCGDRKWRDEAICADCRCGHIQKFIRLGADTSEIECKKPKRNFCHVCYTCGNCDNTFCFGAKVNLVNICSDCLYEVSDEILFKIIKDKFPAPEINN